MPILSGNVQTVAGGDQHSLIVKTDGSLWAMGDNSAGQLGDGTTTNRTNLVQILSGNVQTVAACYKYSLIVKTDGSLWGMGDNSHGQLGDGTTTNRTSPVQICPSGVQAVAARYYHTLILKTDGSLWAMGENGSGQLGDGTTTNRTSPVLVAMNVRKIAAGGSYSMIVASGDISLHAPAVTTHPASQSVADGTIASFGMAISGAATYQWQVLTSPSSTWTNLSDSVTYSGTTTATLAIGAATTAMSSYQYRCVATNPLGSATSNAATLTVTVTPGAPAFSAHPANVTATAGQDITFSATASGTPVPTLKWQVLTSPSGTWTDLSNGGAYMGTTTATLAISSTTTAMSGYQYRCMATNSTGSALSSLATLTVNPFVAAPVFSAQPASTTVTAGQNTSFSATVSGTPTPTVKWQVQTSSTGTWADLSDGGSCEGATTATLAITAATTSMSGYQFRCVATNSVSSVNSTAATLIVNSTTDVPVFSVQPTNATVTIGQNVTFSATASGAPTPALQWQVSTNGGSTWTNLADGAPYSGVTTGTLTITEATGALNNLQFRCVATNSVGSVNSTAATLKVVVGQTITFAPIGSVTVGTAVTLSATASSGLPVSFSVQSGNATITGSTTLTVNDTNPVTILASQVGNTSYGAAPEVTQTVTATAASAGSPQLFFGQISGGSSSSGTAGDMNQSRIARDVIPQSSTSSGARIVQAAGPSTNLAACLNSSGTSGTMVGYISSIGAGFDVSFTISGGAFTATTTALTGGSSAGQPLTFTGILSNGVISGTIQELGLSFTASLEPSTGTSAAVSGLYQASSTSGAVTYSVVGTQGTVFVLAITPGLVSAGTGTVTSSNSFTVTTSQGTTITGTVNPSTTSLTETVTPQGGSPISLTGTSSLVAPTIITQPAARTVSAGQSVSLTVQASGTAPLSYQWYKNGNAINVATGVTLYMSSVTASEVGSYSVVVTNSAGSLESSAAMVAIGTSSRLSALAVRTESGPGADVLIVGIVVSGASGSEKKEVIVRGVGPGLQQSGVANFLSDPEARVYSGSTVIASNDDWNSATMKTTLASVGLDTLASGSKDAAMLAQFADGGYTVQVGAKTNENGVALAEIYESDSMTPSHMSAMAVRAKAGTNEKTLIAGFVIKGAANKRLIIRGLGPALAGASVTGYLADPKLDVYSGSTVIASNDNWGNTQELRTAFTSVGLEPMEANSKDAALIADLPPGGYTVWLTGVNATTGIGLIEIYELP
ncbi:MAG: immunoglobulin domain-containing protein [Opitutaceae bacterium]